MLNLSVHPLPVLATRRLVLRQLTADDAPAIFALRSDKEVNKFLNRSPAVSLDDAARFIWKINDGITKQEWIYWAIHLKTEPALCGTICYWNIEKASRCAETGYELNPAFQGQGIMQEAVQCVIDYGFQQIHLDRITAFPHYQNEKSIRLLEKFNFSRIEKLPIEMTHQDEQNLFYMLEKPVV